MFIEYKNEQINEQMNDRSRWQQDWFLLRAVEENPQGTQHLYLPASVGRQEAYFGGTWFQVAKLPPVMKI